MEVVGEYDLLGVTIVGGYLVTDGLDTVQVYPVVDSVYLGLAGGHLKVQHVAPIFDVQTLHVFAILLFLGEFVYVLVYVLNLCQSVGIQIAQHKFLAHLVRQLLEDVSLEPADHEHPVHDGAQFILVVGTSLLGAFIGALVVEMRFALA